MSLLEEKNRAAQIVAMLDDGDPDKEEILRTETTIYELLDWSIRKDAEIDGFIEMNKALAKDYAERAKRFEKNKDNFRNLIHSMMDDIDEKSYKSPYGTISIRLLEGKIIVDDVSLLPQICIKTDIKPILSEVKKYYEGGGREGLSKTNGGISVTVRRK